MIAKASLGYIQSWMIFELAMRMKYMNALERGEEVSDNKIKCIDKARIWAMILISLETLVFSIFLIIKN